MYGNNNFTGGGGYLPDGTYISPGMTRVGYQPVNNGGYYNNGNPMMNNNGFNTMNNNNNMMLQNQQQQPIMQQTPKLKGRIVTNVEEVKGILIEPDGSTYYFPCPAENCIYTKTIDLNAQSVINVYRLSNNALPAYADMQTVQVMENRIANIENMLFNNNQEQQPKGGVKENDKQQSNKSNATNV